MFVITYTQEDTTKVAVHLEEATATTMLAALEADETVSGATVFGPVDLVQPDSLLDYRLGLRSDSLLQDRLKYAVITRGNKVFTLYRIPDGGTFPTGETRPSAQEFAAARYAILYADQPETWFPKIRENFMATAKPERVTVAGVEEWVKTNFPIFAMLWADKLNQLPPLA